MYSLLLDSSDIYLCVGLAKDDVLLTQIKYEAWQRQSEYMIQEINNVLEKNGISLLNINEVIVSCGPGSYTGVRISLTIAKIIGTLDKNIKIYLTSSLEILKDPNNLSICLINARSNRSYTAIYKGDECILKDCILNNDEVLSLIKNKYKDNISVCGDTNYLDLKGKNNNIFINMLNIRKHIDYEHNPENIKAVYLKESYDKNIKKTVIFSKNGKYNVKLGFYREGGIFMRQDSSGKPRDIITMEEYLKKRQAIKRQEERGAGRSTVPMTAMKLAEILYV